MFVTKTYDCKALSVARSVQDAEKLWSPASEEQGSNGDLLTELISDPQNRHCGAF
jgi:hypothetical protein